MGHGIDRSLAPHQDGQLTRRNLLVLLSTLVAARPSWVTAQSRKPPLILRRLNHATLTVSDPKRSLDFYQGLFGMPIQSRQGPTVVLQIGAGPQCLALAGGGANASPGINHLCMTVDNFDVDRVLKILAEHGISKSGATGGGLGGGPMKSRVRMRGPENGGDKQGTPELYFGDPDGIVVQLQDASYCGGAGARGNICAAKPEASPRKGLFSLRDLSHFTIFASDAARSTALYQALFGMPVQAYQGAMPILAVGAGPQFLALAGQSGGAARGAASAAAAQPRPTVAPRIDHVCFTMAEFNPDRVIKMLAEFGVKPRGSAPGPVGPLTSYVTLRGEDRGGAKEGTPELYFTDPDGILIQLQDERYCGGAGYFGEICRS
jgi:catechol 2,3-dioxygenase-like lactoylglutathione lyase family enzyme